MVLMRTFLLAGTCLVLAGCCDRVRRPSPEELARFQAADQTSPSVDMNRVLQAKIVAGPYRAVPGDVLRLEMPRFLEPQPAQPAADSRQIYNCRIGDDGAIVLPIIGSLAVRGKSLAEIESAIAAQYYPKYVAAPLPVYVSVQEYQMQRVSIVGAVTQPGIHSLRHDQMSLVALLMQAGGIVGQGAAVIRITRATDTGLGPEPVLPLSSEARAGVLQAAFEREGPLRTTGWLQVEQDQGRLSARKWLDIGNEPQRREFLGALASQSQGLATDDLRTRLVQLASYLEERPSANAGMGKPAAGWRTVDASHFVTGSYAWAEDGRRPNRAVAAKTPVEEGDPVERVPPSVVRPPETQTLVLPVRGLNIPFADVTLEEGDTVVVEPPREQSVSIVGLVTRPGNMPYPPGTRYNLIQAIAFAGGLDLVADPRYVSVYRLNPEGEIVSATFQLVNPHRAQQLTDSLALPLRPGDVVSVEHTLRTRTNVFLDRVFRISLGLYVSPERLWND